MWVLLLVLLGSTLGHHIITRSWCTDPNCTVTVYFAGIEEYWELDTCIKACGLFKDSAFEACSAVADPPCPYLVFRVIDGVINRKTYAPEDSDCENEPIGEINSTDCGDPNNCLPDDGGIRFSCKLANVDEILAQMNEQTQQLLINKIRAIDPPASIEFDEPDKRFRKNYVDWRVTITYNRREVAFETRNEIIDMITNTLAELIDTPKSQFRVSWFVKSTDSTVPSVTSAIEIGVAGATTLVASVFTFLTILALFI